ncbi:PREDICTED: uncharacterized protein LOC105963973 [Erythranthe guttata]|uniref:uncharacterized protein LOC105963973 n=1 Tax=Erythranthe guttata TaxID=4155 RepID=UPI00064E05B0|nr:PREDICTED: uncharacterized protein LOC105963973 [Erythranthe guttata]|eukprot:XP_012843928.1 PREDICTED: uncharacterized protein LOC105963973 [Erythranthe guttata]
MMKSDLIQSVFGFMYSDAAAKAKKMPWCMYVMMYTLCITIGLASLKYHMNPDKLFVDNLVPLLCFIASTGFYWLVEEAMKKSTLNPDEVMPNTSGGDHHTRRDCASSTSDEDEAIRRTPVLTYVMTYTFPGITIGLVMLKYHDNPNKVFINNVVPLWCFIASTFVYWLIAEAMKKLTLIKSDGTLSQMSLIFLPYPESLVPLIIWIPMPVIFVTWPISHYMCGMLRISYSCIVVGGADDGSP